MIDGAAVSPPAIPRLARYRGGWRSVVDHRLRCLPASRRRYARRERQPGSLRRDQPWERPHRGARTAADGRRPAAADAGRGLRQPARRWRRHIDSHVFFWATEARRDRFVGANRRLRAHVQPARPPPSCSRSTPLPCWSGTRAVAYFATFNTGSTVRGGARAGATKTRCARSAITGPAASRNWRSAAAVDLAGLARWLPLTPLGLSATPPDRTRPTLRDARETIHARYGRIPVHLRVGLRRAPRQGRRPAQRHGAGRLPRRGSLFARRLRDAGHHQPRGVRRRNPRTRHRHARPADASGPHGDPRHRLRPGRLQLAATPRSPATCTRSPPTSPRAWTPPATRTKAPATRA